MDHFTTWFNRFMFVTEIIFLAASMPHIAAWFAHFDTQTDTWSTVYAWTIGFALAFAIDGVSFMLLLAITRMLKQAEVNGWIVAGLLLFMAFIALLSWEINWQYDVQFASTEFAKADQTTIFHTTIGALNPIIGGAFQVLILAYALIGKAVNVDIQKPSMSDEEYEQEKQRIVRQHELRSLKGSGNGLLFSGKEALLGRGQSEEETRLNRLNAVVDYLRDAAEFLDPQNEERALEAISRYLKMRSKDVLPYLVAARTTIAKEERERMERRKREEQDRIEAREREEREEIERREQEEREQIEEREREERERIERREQEEQEKEEMDQFAGLNGRSTISIEQAASILGCQEKHVATLRNSGKLKHARTNERLITVASIKAYQASRRPRKAGTMEEREPETEPILRVS